MKQILLTNLLALALLPACSTPVSSPTPTARPGRFLAQAPKNIQVISEDKLRELTTKVFHSYLQGQIHLQQFDRLLDKRPQTAMRSKIYSKLLAVRVLVEDLEEQILEAYVDLILVTALSHYSEEQKSKAQKSLEVLGKFFEGIVSDGRVLPENLKPLILSNLREKQTDLYEELNSNHDDPSFTGGDPKVAEVLHRNMVLLRTTRRMYYRDLSNFQVDQKSLDEAIRVESKKRSYRRLKSEIEKQSKDIHRLMAELRPGQLTDSDVIFPSVGAAGNITGLGFPANTWSLTYDDGPGANTTKVLQKLQEKKVKATFFVLARQVEANPNIAKSLVSAGMEIASHSYTHAQLTKSGVNLDREIGIAKSVIENRLGTPIKLFRLPYGAGVNTTRIRQKIADLKLVHVFWNVDTLDWQDKNPRSITERAIKQMKASPNNSGVILFHDIHPQTIIASELLLDHIQKSNLKLCTVQSVVDQVNKGSDSCE